MPFGVPEVPHNIDPTTRRLLQQVRTSTLNAQGSRQPPGPVTNFKVTPIAGGNVLQWTRPADSDRCVVYINSTPSLNGAIPLDVGVSTTFTDNVGVPAVTRYYWVMPMKAQMAGQISPPQKGTTLAPGAGSSVPNPPPETDVVTRDTSLGGLTTPAQMTYSGGKRR